MSATIRSVLDEKLKHLKFDRKFLSKLRTYEQDFVNKNDEHIAFFGGHLTGVHVVRFSPTDRSRWFTEILDAHESDVESALHALPSINVDFNVRSDAMNITCVYLAHRFMTEKTLSEKDRKLGATLAILILYYKFTTSLLAHYFRFVADPAVADATYKELSYKYTLKQLGSWMAYLEDRVDKTIGKDSLHYKTFMKFDVDEDVLYAIGDSQGRVRNTIKSIYSEFIKVHQQGTRISTSSAVVEMNGEEVLRDKTRTFQTQIRYLNSIVIDKATFIKEDLVAIIEKVIPSVPPRLFRQTLEWMSENYGRGQNDLVSKAIQDTLIYSFNYFMENPKLIRGNRDISGMIVRLKGTYTSSRSTDPSLMELRELVEDIAQKATSSKNKTIISSVRTATMLYLVARSLTSNHYA